MANKAKPEPVVEVVPLLCQCGKSSRFVPLYGFNLAGRVPSIILGNLPMVQCAECKQVYTWAPPSEEGKSDGGWERSSLFNELERVGG